MTNSADDPYFCSAARWEHRSEEIRTLVEEYRDPTVREILSDSAADCDVLARRAEERGSRDQELG